VLAPGKERTVVSTDRFGDKVATRTFRDGLGDEITTRTVTDRAGNAVQSTTVQSPHVGERLTTSRPVAPALIRNEGLRDDVLLDSREKTYADRLDALKSRSTFLDDPLWTRSAKYLDRPLWTRPSRYLNDPLWSYRSMSYVDDPKWRRSALNDDTVGFKDPRRAMSPTTWNDSILSPRVMSPRRETTTVTTDSHGDVVETKCLRDVHGDQVVSRTVTDRFGDSRKTTTTGHVRDPRFLLGEKTRVSRTRSGSPIRRIRDDLLVDEGKSREFAASRIDLLNSKGEYLDDPMWRRTAAYTDDHVINRSGDRYLEDPWWTRGTRYLDDPLPRSQTYMDEAKWRRASLYSDLVKRDVDDPIWRGTVYPAHLGGRRLI
jgi:hypothetical protein